MKLGPAWIAGAIGAEILAEGGGGEPRAAAIDSGAVEGGELFFGLRGERVDGGEFAGAALAAGAWGVVVGPGHGADLDGGWVYRVADPLLAMGALAKAWRRELGARVVGVTGSVGKTSVKDIARAILPGRVEATRENLNTEIGLPLTIMEAPLGTEVLVLEMAMRGRGQIAELAAIAEPEVAVITNVGPVHVELLGSVEEIAAAKAEILAGPATAVVPAEAGALEPHLEGRENVLRFGRGGDVFAETVRTAAGVTEARIVTPAGAEVFRLPFTEPYNLTNALAAVAAGVALGAALEGMVGRAAKIGFSRFRGERLELGDRIVLVNDCYNANPVSMRAALDHLAESAEGRRVAVLGEMAELGPEAADFHREIGEHARERGVDFMLGVGAAAVAYRPDDLVADPGEAAEWLAENLEAGDTVLVKGSRSVGLEEVAETLVPMLEADAPGRGSGGQSQSGSSGLHGSRGGGV